MLLPLIKVLRRLKIMPIAQVVVDRTPYEDLVKRVDLAQLYPPFRVKVIELLRRCRLKGWDYYAISGLRDLEEQKALYAQGRTKPGEIVTNARPGRSGHNFAAALDGCRDKYKERSGLQPDWDTASYAVYAEEAVALGLEAGLYYKTIVDAPHVQLPLGRHGLGWDLLITIYNRGGLPAVWKEFDLHSWDVGVECQRCKQASISSRTP